MKSTHTCMVPARLPAFGDWEPTGEYRIPKTGERFLSENKLVVALCDGIHPHYIYVQISSWRAEEGGKYWFLDEGFEPYKCTETGSTFDDTTHKVGNYFRSKREANKASMLLKTTLVSCRHFL